MKVWKICSIYSLPDGTKSYKYMPKSKNKTK